jgi:hypothetical protein
MGDPNTGNIYELAEGQSPDVGHVGLSKEMADKLNRLDIENRKRELASLLEQQTTAQAKSNLEITDDYTSTKVILDELINAHKNSPHKGRERSLVITKLQEARMWLLEAQAQE